MRRHVYAWLVATIAAVFPTVVTAGEQEDQRIADHINQRLIEAKDRGSLNDFSLDLYVEEGQVWFKGHVATEAQEKLVFETAQSAKELGVVKIYDMIEVKGKATPSVEQAALKPQQAQENAVRQTSTDLNGPVVSSARRSNTPAPIRCSCFVCSASADGCSTACRSCPWWNASVGRSRSPTRWLRTTARSWPSRLRPSTRSSPSRLRSSASRSGSGQLPASEPSWCDRCPSRPAFDAKLRLACLRVAPQLRCRHVPAAVLPKCLALHRSFLSLPASSAGMEKGHAGVG